MSSLTLLSEFKSNLIKFFDELIDQFPSESNLVITRIFLKDKIPIDMVMNLFIKDILPEKQLIKDRDEKFFTEGKGLFGMIKTDKLDLVATFKKLWKSPSLDKDDRLTIWKWVDVFVIIAEKYQKSVYK